jgi:phosphopantetheine adenylyltransferase
MKIIAVLLTAAWFMLAATPLAHAEPVTLALFGAAFVAANPLLAAAISYVIGAGIAYGVSLLSQALFGVDEQTQTQGVELNVQMGDDKPMSFIAGTSATAGKRKYIGAWGKDGKTPNAFMTDVIEVGNIPAVGQPVFWVDDQKVTVLWGEPPVEQGHPVLEYRKDGKDYLWFKYYDGTQTAAEAFLLAKFSADPDRPYKSTMIGRGCPYFVATARLNQDFFPQQPVYLCEAPLSAWYDLRKDSSVGGSGSHRWDNPATWEPSDNPVVLIYNITRGVYYGDEWVYGGQNLPAFRLPASNWMAAANECDRLIPLAGGGLEKQFRCGTEVTCDMEPLSVIEKLKKACNGRVAENGGIFKMLVGAPGAAVYSFSDGDILVTKGQTYTPFPGLDATYNGIEATYPEPLEKWATKDAPARYSLDLEAQDGNRRLASGVIFEAVPFSVQVQRLMKLLIEEDRRFRIHSFYLPPDAFPLEPNDVVSWTSVRNGYVNKKFLIVRIDGERGMLQLAVLKEIDPSDYDWSTDEQVPTSAGPVGPIVNPSHPMFGWQALPATLDDGSGPRRPTIEVFYAGDQDGVDRIRIEVYQKDTGSLWFEGEIPYDAPLDEQYSSKLVGVFAPNTDYLVRGIFVSNIGKNFTWSGLIDVTTFDIRLGIDDIYPDGLTDAVKASMTAHLAWQAESSHFAQDQIEHSAALANELSAQSALNIITIRSQVGAVSAKYESQIITVATETEANAARIETVNTQIGESIAEVVSTISAVSTELESVANLVNVVSARVGNFYAEGSLRVESVASIGGASVTIGISAAASEFGVTTQAALFVSAVAGGLSEVGVLASRFYVIGAGAKIPAFVIDGGVLYADQLKVRSANIVDLVVTWADIDDAVINNLVVGTSNIGIDAVSSFDIGPTTDIQAGGSFADRAINMPVANRSLMQLAIDLTYNYATNGGSPTVTVQNLTTGAIVFQKSFGPFGSGSNNRIIDTFFFFGSNAAGSNTFRITQNPGATTGLNQTRNVTLRSLFWKR